MIIIFKSKSLSKCAKRAFDFSKNGKAKIGALVKKPYGKYEIKIELEK